MLRLVALAGLLALAACTSTYHPEYHPVSINNVEQNLAYPVTVNGGGATAQRSGPVYVVPGTVAGGPPLTPPPPPAPPPGFFAPE